jgi:hypothetical protein
MLRNILWLYSHLFRISGLVMAIMSAIVSLWIGVGIVRDGYILVNGHPSDDVKSICVAVGTPLLGVAVGLALFYFMPKVRRDGSGSDRAR